jgi:ElaB/YqjD/DUF883 family membrane-anchored ribosome-binding protein
LPGGASGTGGQSGAGEQPGTAEVVKGQAQSVGQGTAQAGQQVASVAKDQAQNVAAEAGAQAKSLLSQTRDELSSQVGAQQQRLASGLHQIGEELHSMSQGSEQQGVASDLARQASQRSHDIASWLDSREPGHLVEEIKRFARQRPGAFLAIAAGAGLLAGRLTRGVKDASSDDTDSAGASGAARSTGGWSSDTLVETDPTYVPGSGAYRAGEVESVRPFSSSQDDLGDVSLGGERR